MSAGLATVAYDGESFVYLLIFAVFFLQKFMVYYKSSHFLKNCFVLPFCSRPILRNSNKEEHEENIGFFYQIIDGKLYLM